MKDLQKCFKQLQDGGITKSYLRVHLIPAIAKAVVEARRDDTPIITDYEVKVTAELEELLYHLTPNKTNIEK